VAAGLVSIRNVSAADLPIFFEHQLDLLATRLADFPSRDRPAFMVHWARIMAQPDNILKTILFDSQVAGNVVSWEHDGQREVGYWLGREYWGKGIATRALAAFLAQVKTRPLVAHVARHNLASLRVLQKCGFSLYAEDGLPSAADAEQPQEFTLQLPS
jgi:RimJ/RimL family protein N-acetyltransferase